LVYTDVEALNPVCKPKHKL